MRKSKVRKLKGEEKMPQMNEKTANLQENKGVRNKRGAISEDARKLEAQKLKAINLKGHEF